MAQIFFERPLIAPECEKRATVMPACGLLSTREGVGGFADRVRSIRDNALEEELNRRAEVLETRAVTSPSSVLSTLMSDASLIRRAGDATPVAAVSLGGTSSTLDTAKTWDVPVGNRFRNFGHAIVEGSLWDRSGNWADSGTAVTADQLAAMPQEQQKAFLARVGLDECVVGDSSRAFYESAGSSKVNPWASLAQAQPDRWVVVDSHRMRAETAARFWDMRSRIESEFPGKRVRITSTTTGRHMSSSHPDGRAVDFTVSGLSVRESYRVEALAGEAGFKPFNEYVKGSRHKTGDHMHVSLR